MKIAFKVKKEDAGNPGVISNFTGDNACDLSPDTNTSTRQVTSQTQHDKDISPNLK